LELVNKAALRRQMKILKDMGCNAIRSSQQHAFFRAIELADEMGFMFWQRVLMNGCQK
jgi:beta-galactosidase